MNYYQRLKDVREDHDLNQEDIANLLKTSQQQYGKYELGKQKMSIERYIFLSKYYNISLDYLCGILETPEPLWRGTPAPKIKRKINEEEKIIQAYKKAPQKIKNVIKTILEIEGE